MRDLSNSGRLPSVDFREQRRRRRAAERDLRRRLAAAGASAAALRAFFGDLRLAQTFLPLRETIKHYYTGEYRALRQILLEINRRLGWEDDDVFYLDPSELPSCFHSPETLVPLVRQRRRLRKIATLLAGKRRIPAVIFASDVRAIGARPARDQSRHLKGMPRGARKSDGICVAAGRYRRSAITVERYSVTGWRRKPRA